MAPASEAPAPGAHGTLPSEVFPGATIEAAHHLNKGGRAIRVSRLALRLANGQPRSVIVKELLPFESNDQRNARDLGFLQEERANYVFLESLQPRFPLAPRLLGHTPAQLFLEDLGASDPLMSTHAMVGVVARSLSTLHAATTEAEPLYLAVRKDLGCEKQPDTTWLHIRLSDAFQAGSARVLAWCSALAPGQLAMLTRHVEDAHRAVTQPQGTSRAFIHHDMVSSRQCILRSGSLFLLDFEHSRFGHRLLDVATLLVGKLEVTHGERLVPIHASLPPAFANAYRREWDLMRTSPMSDLDWQRELVSVMVWQTLTEIGRCLSMPQRTYVLGFLGTIRSFLQRLQDQLILFGDAVPLKTTLGELLYRMQGAPAGQS